MTEFVITERHARATSRYEKLVETSQTTTHAHKRLDSAQKVRAAKAALSRQEAAILDMVVIRGRTLEALAEATKQPRDHLERLFLRAAETLAQHFDPPTAADRAEDVA